MPINPSLSSPYAKQRVRSDAAHLEETACNIRAQAAALSR